MNDVFADKSQALAEEMGWTTRRAEGYVDGEAYRRRGLEISAYHKIALDEYAQGFRTGYYKEAHSLPSDDSEKSPAAA
ncbi:MAG: hypothetical protein JSU95_14130 [Betaproteobacteria bacterium]|nr:MAG: hypothetical protein JSU95_14130 [Betaproteobacteria bacterium]